ncbi:hypothetical protein F5B20DRAFT_585330 [Whalleya microplaca]|nr:hypothetical protein F5B20DRAFT_585330 [Whalleya microplaca]
MFSLQTITTAALAILLFSSSVSAHFTVQYPPTVGVFNDDAEGTAPCGGYNPDLTQLNTTDFHVNGDSVVTTLTHPEANWLYRITVTNGTIPAEANWTEIYPITKQSGAGVFCLSHVTVPSEFVGKKGILSLVASALDGLLYQCSAVKFVDGTGATPTECTNGTNVSGSPSSDTSLSALVGTAVAASSSSAVASATSKPNAGASITPSAFNGGLGAAVTTAIMILLGAALMI